jgi:AraC family transcriptional regulator of adaptative response/methylated-DNA-[protein]-cysteine methyltransferase
MASQNQTADIAFTTGPSTLGTVLVATSKTGIVAILLGDDPDALARDLHARFPNSRLTRGADSALLTQVTAFIEAPRTGWTLPLDLRGTPFQRRVWDALRGIPAGATATYAGIAGRIGAPRAMRAVASACAANALAVAIPCHRVIRQDGTLSGYRWGADRKRALLAREACA